MEEKRKKESILFMKLDLAFVYLFILFIGIAIVLIMTSYINNKVNEFNNQTVAIANKNVK